MGFFSKWKQKKEAERRARERAEQIQRVRANAKMESEQLLKILNDCTNLVNTTKSPEVFFGRYDLLLETLKKLSSLELTGIYKNSPELPSEALPRIQGIFAAATNDFIDRSFEAAQEKAGKLKTEKGKQNALRRYFDDMEQYTDRMESESVDYLASLKTKQNILGEQL